MTVSFVVPAFLAVSTIPITIVITVGFDLTEFNEVLFLLVDGSERFSRNVDDVKGKSVSSKLSESDFDATDNELLLR